MMKQKALSIGSILTVLTALGTLILKILCALILPQTEPRNGLHQSQAKGSIKLHIMQKIG